MEIKNVGIDAVRPYKKNAKKHDETQINAVMNSIKTYGFQQPIVVDRNGVIVIGHCRYEAAKRLGLATVPAVVKDDLSDDEIKALRIVDNKTNESEWNTALLSGELKELANFGLTSLGFSEADLLELTRDIQPERLRLDNENQYVKNAQSQLEATRIICIYKTQEEENWLLERLGADNLNIVTYIANLMK